MGGHCEGCGGKGYIWIIPAGKNPFDMKMPAIERAMMRETCRICEGTGRREPSRNPKDYEP